MWGNILVNFETYVVSINKINVDLTKVMIEQSNIVF